MVFCVNDRYFLFSGSHYYPSGGWSDFKGSFATIEDALRADRKDWWHIVDMTTGKIIETNRIYELIKEQLE